MTALRKRLPLLCCLLAALWLFSLSAGMLGACLAPLSEDRGGPLTAMTEAHAAHDPVLGASVSTGAPDAGERVACVKQCETSLGGVLKPSPPDVGHLAVFALAAFCVVSLASLPTTLRARRIAFSPIAIIGDPPPTIRFHRFNN